MLDRSPQTVAADPAATFNYRAFLSYSHRDTAWAKWLHRALEAYRIDKDLVGRATAHGPVPKSLRPIFRDREDFSAGHSLTEQTLAALDASQSLIVICSPNAARSAYVNEEIRYFKSLGRAGRVIDIIIAGEPGDPEQECFPPAVRFRVGADGAVTDEREEPVAADARQQGDGKEAAKHKVVAGLLGVGLDEILRRAKRARQRQLHFRVGAALATALLVAAAFLGWRGVSLVYGKLLSAEDLNYARDAADICEHANSVAVADKWRIIVALRCVNTFTDVLSDLPQGALIPARVARLFAASRAILRKYEVQRRLTADQSESLRRADALAERF